MSNAISEKDRKLDKVVKLILLPFVICLVFFIIKSCNQQRSDRKEIIFNLQYTTGIITYHKVNGHGWSINYKYEVDGVSYINSQPRSGKIICGVWPSNSCLGRVKKVIYSKKNPEKSQMLATKRDYEEYLLKVPPELK